MKGAGRYREVEGVRPSTYLKPTFLKQRKRGLEPVKIAVLEVNDTHARIEVLGSGTTPVWLSLATVRSMLEGCPQL